MNNTSFPNDLPRGESSQPFLPLPKPCLTTTKTLEEAVIETALAPDSIFFVTEKRHKRRSIHLKGYDYRQEGMYFITVCAFN